MLWPTVPNWTDGNFDCFDLQFQTEQMETLTALTYSSKLNRRKLWPTVPNKTGGNFKCFDLQFQTEQMETLIKSMETLTALTYSSKLNRWKLWLLWPTVPNWTDGNFDCFDLQFQTEQMKTLIALNSKPKRHSYNHASVVPHSRKVTVCKARIFRSSNIRIVRDTRNRLIDRAWDRRVKRNTDAGSKRYAWRETLVV